MLLEFWKQDREKFDEILGKLDKDTEEYKRIKRDMDSEISHIISELKRELEDTIRDYEKLSERL